MRAGELDRRIVIEQNTPTDNSFGEPIDSWTTLATVYAKVKPVREEEKFKFEQSVAFDALEFTVRYQEQFRDYKLRIVHQSKIYDIMQIREMGRKEALVIVARAQV